MGPVKAYDFTVTVAPQGARGDPKTVNGSLVHRPLLPSWAPVLGFLKTIVVLALLIAGVSFALRLGGGVTGFQMGIIKLWNQAAALVTGSPAPASPAAGTLSYSGGFKMLHDAAADLVGDPVENAVYDVAGNGYQNTKKGTLFWLKSTNTVYYFTPEAVYVFRDDRVQAIDGKPR